MKKWFKCAFIRMIKTMAQTALSLITIGQAFTDVKWAGVVSVSIVAGILSLLTSLAGLPEVENENL